MESSDGERRKNPLPESGRAEANNFLSRVGVWGPGGVQRSGSQGATFPTQG